MCVSVVDDCGDENFSKKVRKSRYHYKRVNKFTSKRIKLLYVKDFIETERKTQKRENINSLKN